VFATKLTEATETTPLVIVTSTVGFGGVMTNADVLPSLLPVPPSPPNPPPPSPSVWPSPSPPSPPVGNVAPLSSLPHPAAQQPTPNIVTTATSERFRRKLFMWAMGAMPSFELLMIAVRAISHAAR